MANQWSFTDQQLLTWNCTINFGKRKISTCTVPWYLVTATNKLSATKNVYHDCDMRHVRRGSSSKVKRVAVSAYIMFNLDLNLLCHSPSFYLQLILLSILKALFLFFSQSRTKDTICFKRLHVSCVVSSFIA